MSRTSTNIDIPFVTTDQMREVDRAMVENYGILLIQMMENAGRHLAHLGRDRFLGGDPREHRVLVLAGTGGNGGGGLVCARRLHNWGAEVRVWATAPSSEFSEVPGQQLAILGRMGVPVSVTGEEADLPPVDLLIDAVIGYSLKGEPAGTAATLIRAANDDRAPVLSLDAPSGVDTGTGEVHEPAIRATATLTLALPKVGLSTDKARSHVGELYLAGIGVPPRTVRRPPHRPRRRPTVRQRRNLTGVVRDIQEVAPSD